MNPALPNSFRSGPDERGHFGNFGGRFVAETLMPLVLSLEQAYEAANQITDEKQRAQALIDVINEINYFTQNQQHEAE